MAPLPRTGAAAAGTEASAEEAVASEAARRRAVLDTMHAQAMGFSLMPLGEGAAAAAAAAGPGATAGGGAGGAAAIDSSYGEAAQAAALEQLRAGMRGVSVSPSAKMEVELD